MLKFLIPIVIGVAFIAALFAIPVDPQIEEWKGCVDEKVGQNLTTDTAMNDCQYILEKQ